MARRARSRSSRANANVLLWDPLCALTAFGGRPDDPGVEGGQENFDTASDNGDDQHDRKRYRDKQKSKNVHAPTL